MCCSNPVAEEDSAIGSWLPVWLHLLAHRGQGQIKGRDAAPTTGQGKHPAVVVVHENRGLNPCIKDVARRLAKAGFVALAPDVLTRAGVYPGNDEKGKELQATVDPTKLMNDLLAAVEVMMTHEAPTGAVGITGFCFGGGVANAAAVAYPDLKAAVPKIKAALMLHFGALDGRVNASWPEMEAALQAAGTEYQAFIYEGDNHGFHDDSTPRHDATAAELAWGRTVEFFKAKLV